MYKQLSCIVGGWLDDWIKRFLLKLKDTRDFAEDDRLNQTYQTSLKSGIRVLLNEQYTVQLAILVLSKVLAKSPQYAYYANVTMLRALVQLNIKLAFVRYYREETFSPTGNAIMRSIIEEFYSIKHYMFVHSSLDRDSGQQSIVDFLTVLHESLSQSVVTKVCSPKTMLFGNIITFPPEDYFAWEILQSNVIIAKEKKVNIYRMLENMSETVDSEFIYMYQKAIMTATMKFIYYSMEMLNETDYLHYREHIINLVNAISIKISQDPNMFPELMVDGFLLLPSIVTDRPNFHKQPEHINYIQLLNSIELYEKDQTEIFFLEYYSEFPLIKLLKRILNYIEDLKCFNQSVQYRFIEYEKYHTVFFETKNYIDFQRSSGTEHTYESGDVCTFIENIVTICNLGLRQIDRLDEHFSNVTQYIFVILKNKSRSSSLNLIKILTNIAIILINLPSTYNNQYKRNIVNVIITKLNNFGTAFCNPIKYKFWFYNVSTYNDTTNTDFLSQFMKKFNSKFILEASKIETNDSDFIYMNIKNLCDTHINNSNIIRNFRNYINFYWKWELKSILDISAKPNILGLNSEDLYAFYNIYFKFYIAIVFYSLKEYYEKLNVLLNDKLSLVNKHLTDFKVENFPSELHYFIIDIKNIFSIESYKWIAEDDPSRNDTISCNMSDNIKRIEKTFEQHGIKLLKPETEENLNILSPDKIEIIKNILLYTNRELRDHVKIVNSLFSRLRIT